MIETYKGISEEFHSGVILPVGEEPSGRSWTGFQSVSDDASGYMLVFREDNMSGSAEVDTWLDSGAEVRFDAVAGDGVSFTAVAGNDGVVEFALPERNTFALYRYTVL